MIGLMIGLALRWRPAHISGSQSWIGGEGTSGLATSGSEPYHSQADCEFPIMMYYFNDIVDFSVDTATHVGAVDSVSRCSSFFTEHAVPY